MKTVFVGIDVAKNSLEVCVGDKVERWTATNDDEGIAETVTRIKKHIGETGKALVVLEATGGYESLAAASLYAENIPVIIANPRQVRDFAKGYGIMAKTDAIDARVLALFAQKVRPEVRELLAGGDQAFKELMKRRMQLVAMRTSEKNRLGLATGLVQESILQIIAAINREIAAIDKNLDQFIKSSPVWCEKAEIIQSVPGIGSDTMHLLIGCLPELGVAERNKVTRLVGVAPLNDDSGKKNGPRSIQGGRHHVRSALYMPTLSAIQHNPVIKTYYQQLISKGKPRQLAVIACMRKLIIILDAMLKNNTVWCPNIS